MLNHVDDFHGTLIEDPFRWLEDPELPETKAFIQAQNEAAQSYLHSLPIRESVRRRLLDLWQPATSSTPEKIGSHYFFRRNNGMQHHAVLYRQAGLEAVPLPVLDPNEWRKDDSFSLTYTSISPDGQHIAYAVSEKGSDWQTIRIRNLDSLKDCAEVLRGCRFTMIAWSAKSDGFYYSRDQEVATGKRAANAVYWHALGTEQEDDRLIYHRPDQPDFRFQPMVTRDGQYLLLIKMRGSQRANGLLMLKLPTEEAPKELIPAFDALHSPIGNRGKILFLRTTYEAPKGRVVTLDLDHPERTDWRELVPETDAVLSAATLCNGCLVLVYMRDARHEVKVHDLNGQYLHDIPLQTAGNVTGLSARDDDDELFLGFTSFLYPKTIFRYNLKSRTMKPFFQPDIPFNPSLYETRQVFCTSKDGTRIPLFLTCKKGLAPDGSHPALLVGYGGFGVSMHPKFSAPAAIFLEHGGVYVTANIRGGNEYGADWHRAGTLERKQNVFDDFIAAAEWLIDQGYTKPGKLAIAGGSNGGLLVTACMVQRPDLFGAVVARVPVTDMLRYHKFESGKYWIQEYGNAEQDPEHFRFLFKYSPLHNIRNGTDYPPLLILTADSDDRVAPAHAYKFAARLQDATPDSRRVLLRVDAQAGHGHGKSMAKRLDEECDVSAFILTQLQDR